MALPEGLEVRADGCGFYGDTIVVADAIYEREATPEYTFTARALSAETGEVVWELSLPGVTWHHRVGSLNIAELGEMGFSGRLPRFVPIELTRHDSTPSEEQWVMLDVENGVIHTKGAFDDEKGNVTFFRFGEVWVASSTLRLGGGEWLAALDGRTGEVLRGWEVEGMRHGAHHRGVDGVWAYARWAWTRTGDMALYRFSLPGLDVVTRPNPTHELVDVTPRIREAFGQE